MRYILITNNGRIREFYILAMAELYQVLEGGTVISDKLYSECLKTNKVDEQQKCVIKQYTMSE